MKTNRSSGWKAPTFLGVALLFFVTFLYTHLYLQTTNTLEKNGHWISTKSTFQKGIIGGVAYVITPAALHRDQLNLGALFGFQEVLTRDKIAPKEITFDLKLPESSYTTLLYNKGPHGFSGIRLSRNPLYESAHLTAQADGKFLSKDSFELKNWKEGWNHLRILFGNDEVTVFLNDQPLTKANESLLSQGQIGFRGGPFEASVDNVKILLKDGSAIIETFHNQESFWKVFFEIFFLFSLLNTIIFLWAQNKSRKNPGIKISNYTLTANLLLLLLQPILFTAQYYCLSKFTAFSKLYFKAAVALRDIPSTIESREEVLSRLKKEYPEGPSNNGLRILFIGTSQTWGAGTNKPDEIFVQRLEKTLNETSDRKTRYELINGGIKGERALNLFSLYENDWIHWQPQWVVLNLSNNDEDPARFSEALNKFVNLNRLKGIQTLFILEPNTIEAIRSNLPANHQRMRDLSQRFEIPLIDLQSCLDKKHDEGFLWWDFVHLSSFGHEEAAQCLIGPIQEILGKTAPIPAASIPRENPS